MFICRKNALLHSFFCNFGDYTSVHWYFCFDKRMVNIHSVTSIVLKEEWRVHILALFCKAHCASELRVKMYHALFAIKFFSGIRTNLINCHLKKYKCSNVSVKFIVLGICSRRVLHPFTSLMEEKKSCVQMGTLYVLRRFRPSVLSAFSQLIN